MAFITTEGSEATSTVSLISALASADTALTFPDPRVGVLMHQGCVQHPYCCPDNPVWRLKQAAGFLLPGFKNTLVWENCKRSGLLWACPGT